MQQKCTYVWPSNHQVCGGEVVPCTEFPEPDESCLMTWHRLYGSQMYETAKSNPDKAICLSCGTLYPLQESLFSKAAALLGFTNSSPR